MQRSFFSRLKSKDALIIAGLFAFAMLIFSKTVFLGKPISHLYLVGSRDVMFRSFYSNVDTGYDESNYLMHIPFLYLVTDFWRNLQIPLWNPYAGFGAPLIGDVTARPFSIFKIPFLLFPSIYTINFTLVLELTIACIGTYVLCGAFAIPRYARIFAACAYFLCPYLLRNSELNIGTSASMLPLLMWTFVRLAQSPSIPRVILAAIGCALFISIGHAISAFNGVMFSTLVAVLIFFTTGSDKPQTKLLNSAKWLTFVAGLALCLASPVLLPFVEFFKLSNCYKFGEFVETGVAPWQGILVSLFMPLHGGASPFIGIATLPLVCLAWFTKQPARNLVRGLILLAVFAFLGVTRPGFTANIWDLTFLRYIPGLYFEPIFLLLLLITAAHGFETAVENLKGRKLLVIFLAAQAIVLAVPPLLNLSGFDFKLGNFDNSVPDMRFQLKIWLICLAAGTVVAASAFLIAKNRLFFIGSVILATLVSLWQATPLALPVRPNFRYDQIEPLPFLQKEKARIVSLGFDLLAPNTNLVYKIANVNTHNVMPPQRYKTFMDAAGGRVTTFNTVFDREEFSKLIDVCGVKYIMALGSVRGKDDYDEGRQTAALEQPVSYEGNQDIKLQYCNLRYCPERADVVGELKFEPGATNVDDYFFQVVVLGDQRQVLWFGGQYPLKQSRWREKEFPKEPTRSKLSAPIPLAVPIGSKFTVALKVSNLKQMQSLKPLISDDKAVQSGSKIAPSDLLVLGTFTAESRKTKGQAPHFKLISESGLHKIRVYENTRTLGRAFLLFQPEVLKSEGELLARLKAKDFNPHKTVVVEAEELAANGIQLNAVPTGDDVREALPVAIDTDAATKISMTVDAPADAVLVLADTYYPGWKARVDGKEVPIFHADYLFRGVQIPAGKHTVEFSYSSKPFNIALVLFSLGLIASAVLLVRSRSSSRRESSQ
ncbi:MAG: hypothetical protein C0507_24075 [Cyanobacteria bacterium PR.3.49]|nr:hypothetical protein [Cyanobacteria bacterium PR.3.49]